MGRLSRVARLAGWSGRRESLVLRSAGIQANVGIDRSEFRERRERLVSLLLADRSDLEYNFAVNSINNSFAAGAPRAGTCWCCRPPGGSTWWTGYPTPTGSSQPVRHPAGQPGRPARPAGLLTVPRQTGHGPALPHRLSAVRHPTGARVLRPNQQGRPLHPARHRVR